MATIEDILTQPIVETTMNADTVVSRTPSSTVAPSDQAPMTPGGEIVDQPDRDIPNESKKEALGVGTQGEVQVWEARYSLKNFVGRLLLWGAVSIAWIALAIASWAPDPTNSRGGLRALAIISGTVLGFIWLGVLWRIVQARFGHYYRLTNRRVFVYTGVFRRREDQMELLRLQDVFVRQDSLMQRMMSVGTTVLVPNDKSLPTLYLTGIDTPQNVMDVVWDHARAERDRRSVKVDQI